MSSAVQRRDCVLTELEKEEQLTNEIRELLLKQICILLHKLRSDTHFRVMSELLFRLRVKSTLMLR